MATRLSDIEIQRQLAASPGWTRRGQSLTKTYEFKNFLEALAFVNRAGDAAEKLDHHPDMDIRYNKVACHLSTHSAGGITERDFALAAALDGLSTAN